MEEPQIKLSESDIDESNPWADDALKRRLCAETLTNFLKEQNSALTVALNGPWGTGKTFFLKRWAQDLKNSGHKVIYFNAWQDDCLEDPLVAIVGLLWQNLKGGTFDEVCSSLKEAAVPVLRKVGIGLLNQGFKISTGISVEAISEECLKTGCESAFDEYEKQTKYREDFKKRLQEFTDKIFKETGSSLVFIVDELDRCRPDFAVKVLERIKHLFDIDHVIFVLGIDREQLGHVIRSVYGDIDVENYLHRFIDLDFLLPKIKTNSFVGYLWQKYEIPRNLSAKANVYPQNRGDIEEGKVFGKLLIDLLAFHNFSLREIEHCLKIYVLLLRATPAHIQTWPQLAAILIILKHRDRNLYRRWLENSATPNEIADKVLPLEIKSERMMSYLLLLAVVYSSFKVPYFVNDGTGLTETVSGLINAIKEKDETSILSHPFSGKILKKLRQGELETFTQYVDSLGEFNRTALFELSKRIDLIQGNSHMG